MSTPRRPPTRRATLAALLSTTITGALLAGCGVRWVSGTEPTPTPERSPDDVAREATVAETVDLLALLSAASGAAAPLSTIARSAAQTCAAHLVALGATAGSAPSTNTATPAPEGSQQAPAVVDRIAAAAATAFTDGTAFLDVSGPMARLLTSIAASRTLLADTVAEATGVPAPAGPAPANPPTTGTGADPDPSDDAGASPGTAALQAALAGEHAAVFGFALVVGRVGAARRSEAEADLAAHRIARDDLVDLLLARGVDPVPAEAAYDVQAPTEVAAAALAATLQERLAVLYADAVAAAAGDRPLAGSALVTAARDARRWGSSVVAFPGVPDLGEDGSPVPTVPDVTAPTP